MEFQETEEQTLLRETVRQFALKEIAPHSRDWDERQHFPRELFVRLGALGMMGALVDREHGGAGLDYPSYAIGVEELARVDGAIGLSVAAHNSLCINHIDLVGSPEQKRDCLPRLATGEALGAWALTEPDSGSDAAAARTRAVRDGSQWVLNGTKSFCTHGSVADVFVILALTRPEDPKHGMSAFLVQRGTEGLAHDRKEDKLGCRASDTASLVLADCRVPDRQLLGEEGRGFIDALRVIDGGRISIAAMSLGMAQGALDCSLRYSQERRQFGEKISSFQAIQAKLADMATRVEASRLLTYRAAWLKQRKKTSIPEQSSMAKLYASEAAVWVAEQAIQIHGGYGYTKDFPPEKIWRDAKIGTIGEGTSEIQRMVIARELLN